MAGPFDDDLMEYGGYGPAGCPVRRRAGGPFMPMLRLPRGCRERWDAISEMDRELGSMVLGSDDYLRLAVGAHSSNVHWSTAIEGNPLSEDEVRRIALRFAEGRTAGWPDGPCREVANHMRLLLADPDPDVWDAGLSGRVHSLLLDGTGCPGDLRAPRGFDVGVFGADGSELFIPCPHARVESEMDGLFRWLEGSPYGPVCTAALFFHEFESIHPYADGNGRTGRALFQMLLRRLGLRRCGLCRFEHRLLKDRGRYYALLAYTDESGDYAPFASYVTDALARAYSEAVEAFGRKDRLRDADEATRAIALAARGRGGFTSREAAGWARSRGQSAVLQRIALLTDLGILRREGSGRSTRYAFDDPFELARRRIGGIWDSARADGPRCRLNRFRLHVARRF